MKKSIFLTLFVAVSICFLGFGADARAANPALPITLQAYGNSYTVTKYEVKKDEEGKTMIVLIGTGWPIVPMRNGNLVIPISCSLIANGQKFDNTSFRPSQTKAEYFFDTSAQPEALIISPNDNPEKKVTINLK